MKLLKSLKMGEIYVKNRVVMPPMCMYKSSDSGKVKSFHKLHYAARALGGVGMIIVEATAVQKRGRISDYDLGLWDDDQVDSHAALVKDVKKFNTTIGIQLAHAGRKSKSSSTQCVSCSATRFSDEYESAKELEKDEIYELIDAFVDSAKRAMKAGYDFVEIHAAHGYLIHQFLSPLTNLRKDEFGGDFFARARVLFDICKELKTQNIPFGVRISADEWEIGGFGVNDSKILSSWLEAMGAIYIHVSSGGNHEKPSLMPRIEPFYQVMYAKEIKSIVKIPVIAVGLITTPNQGELLLKGEFCDMVAYGRELIRNPNLVQFVLARDDKDELESSYKRAF